MELAPPYLDRYRIERALGAGGQARVFLAQERGGEGRKVALKVLHWDASDKSRERFLREARALSSLRHPSLVRFLDLHLDHEPPLLVMEAVAGSDLREVLAALGPLPPERVRAMGAALASALALLHAKGFVHRDLKPENVLLPPGQDPVLVDLGLVRQDGAARLTRTGAVVGTPGYLAPEVIALRPAGPAADLFALGQVLYEAAAGRPAFALPQLLAAAGGKALSPGPAQLLAERLGPEAAACLALDPQARPGADSLARALAGPIAAPEPRRAPDPVPAARPRPGPAPAPPRRPGLLVLAMVFAAGLAGLVVGRLRPVAPLASLRFEVGPRAAVATYQGDEASVPTELLIEGVGAIQLGGEPGASRRAFGLGRPVRVRVQTGGRPRPFGDPPVESLELVPALPAGEPGSRLALGSEGLELRLPQGAWLPARVRFVQDGRGRVADGRDGPGYRAYALPERLDGYHPVSVELLAPDEAGEEAPLAGVGWVVFDPRPRGLKLARQRPAAPDGPYAPFPTRLLAAPPPEPVPRGTTPALFRTASLYAPGPLRAPLAGRDYWWIPCSDPEGCFVAGLPADRPFEAGGEALEWGLYPGFLFVPDFNLGRFPGGLGLRGTHLGLDPSLASRWLVTRAPGQGESFDLATAQEPFDCRLGPLPVPGGGLAFYSMADVQRRLTPDGAPEGNRLLADPPQVFAPRRGALAPGGRLLALAGHLPKEDGRDWAIELVDPAGPRVLGRIDGLPTCPPSHPLLIEEGPSRGLWFVTGPDLVRVDLDRWPAPPPAPAVGSLAALEAAGAATATPLLARPDTRADGHQRPRSAVACAGPFAAAAFFDDAADPGLGPDRLGDHPIEWHRWKALILSPAGRAVLELDDGPFPVGGPGLHASALALDPALGYAAFLVDGARERWSLDLVSLTPPRVLVQWSFEPQVGVLAPALTPQGILLAHSPGRIFVLPLPVAPGP